MKRCILAIAAVFAVLCTVKPAEAALLDLKTLGYEYIFQGAVYDSTTLNVNAGVELAALYGDVANSGTLDVSDTNVFVAYARSGSWNPSDFNGFRLFDVSGTIDPFTSVTISAATNLVGFDASRVTFDADNIYVNWQGLSSDAERTVVSLDVTGTPVPVPEPSSLLLFGTAAAGMAGRLLRRSGRGRRTVDESRP